MTGSMVELFAGHNWRVGSFVVGGQVEGTVFSDVALKPVGSQTLTRNRTTATTFNNVTTTTLTNERFDEVFERNDQLRSNFGVIGRLGYLVTPDLLLYGLGGLALGNFVYPDDGEIGAGKNSKWVAGYTAGAGGEYRIDEHWSLRAEYRYLHFDIKRSESSVDTEAFVGGGTTLNDTITFNTARKTDADFHVGKVGLAYRFAPDGKGPISAMAAIPSSVAVADSWAGLYYGLYFGAGAGRAKATETSSSLDQNTTVFGGGTQTTTDTQSAFAAGTGNTTGSMVDLFAGHNWRFGSVVVGGQVEGTLFSDVTLKASGASTTAGTRTTVVTPGNVVATQSFLRHDLFETNQQLRSNVGAIGRLGFLVTPDVLLYGLGGLALGHFSEPDANAELVTGGKNGKWVAGYTAGAGGEVKLNDNWSLRAEYRFLHYDVKRDEALPGSSLQSSGATVTSSVEDNRIARQTGVDLHLGKVGVVYKFGPGGSPMSAMAAVPASLATADSWAGPYFGAYFGAGAGRANESFTASQMSQSRTVQPGNIQTGASSNTSVGSGAGDVTGSTLDLFAGYNWRFGSVVAGGQLEGTVFSDVALKTLMTSVDASTSNTTFNGVAGVPQFRTGVSQVNRNDQLRSNFNVVGRLGYLVTPDILLYGLGGLALGHFVYPDSGDLFGGDNGKWVAGYTAGAGGELKLNENWSLRAEYRYLHFDVKRDEAASGGTENQAATVTSSDASNSAAARRTDVDFHIGKVGVVYKFTPPGAPRSAMAAIPAALANSDPWAGFYFGAYFGSGAGRAKGDESQNTLAINQSSNPATTSTTTTVTSAFANSSGDVTGSRVDLFAGHNWRFGSFVVGGQLEGTVFSDVSFKTLGTSANSSVSTTVNTTAVLTTTSTQTVTSTRLSEYNNQLRSNFGAIGRAGFLVTPNVLLYGLGGLALGNFVYPDNNDRFGGSNGKWVTGYTAGAGGELKLTENWFLRGEYRYQHFAVNRSEADFGTATSQQGTSTSNQLNTSATTRHTDVDFHMGKVGVVYKFGAQ